LNGQGSPAASTPATDGERVAVYFGSCGLIAYDFAGEELWRYKLPVAETNNDFGSGASPIIVDGKVVLARDLKADSAVMALDVKTGSLLWKSDRPGLTTAYSTPVVWDADGSKQLIVSGGLVMKSYDLESGSERWLLREVAAVNCSSPIVGDGQVFFSGWSPAGEDAPMPDFKQILGDDPDKDGKLSKPESQTTFLKDFFESNDQDKDGFITQAEWDGMLSFLKKGRNRLIAVKSGGAGDITDTHISWEKTKGLPYVPSPLLYQGKLYIVKDGGLVSCFDAKTGAASYELERLGITGSFYASPVAANGHIYVISLAGKAATLSAGDKLSVKWQSDFKETVNATPAIVGNRLIVRTESKLLAFKAAE
jgi:outer membrane protein assembly factor BamB